MSIQSKNLRSLFLRGNSIIKRQANEPQKVLMMFLGLYMTKATVVWLNGMQYCHRKPSIKKKKGGSRTEHSLSNRKSNRAVLMRTMFSIHVLKSLIKILILLFRSSLFCSVGLHMFQICIFKYTPYLSTIISFSGLLINIIFLVSYNSFFYFLLNIFPLISHHVDLFSGTVSRITRS